MPHTNLLVSLLLLLYLQLLEFPTQAGMVQASRSRYRYTCSHAWDRPTDVPEIELIVCSLATQRCLIPQLLKALRVRRWRAGRCHCRSHSMIVLPVSAVLLFYMYRSNIYNNQGHNTIRKPSVCPQKSIRVPSSCGTGMTSVDPHLPPVARQK